MRNHRAILALTLTCVLAVAAQAAAVRPGVAASRLDNVDATCRSISLRVALADGQPAGQTVSATYCEPLSWAPGPHEADVLTPGATYNRSYWNWPVDPSLYSYVDKTLQAGRATVGYDRVGTGASSRPPSVSLTIISEAYVLHQIVTWLRTSLGYGQVNLVGHSLGSVISIQEAGTYHDASRVVVTGLLHAPNVGAGFGTTLASLLYPAALDPQFVLQGLDVGYLTTMPGDRGADFYSASADPTVVGYDEGHKDVVPTTDLATLASTWALPAGTNASDSITASVLVVIGEQDAIFCTDPPALDCSDQNDLLATEQPYYASASSISIDTIPNTGHDIALHPSADSSFAQINQWITTH